MLSRGLTRLMMVRADLTTAFTGSGFFIGFNSCKRFLGIELETVGYLRQTGNISQTFPCSSLPLADLDLCNPSSPHAPHCLKKKFTFFFKHWSLTFKAHASFIGLAPLPDSPPTITQLIPLNGKTPRSSSNGSAEMNLVLALMARRSFIRGLPYYFIFYRYTQPRIVWYLSVGKVRLHIFASFREYLVGMLRCFSYNFHHLIYEIMWYTVLK